MCQDLGNLECWSRLPMQLILLVISYLYKSKIIIMHSNTGHHTDINAYNNNNLPAIYLGLLGESHYVPIDTLNDDETADNIYYTDAYENFVNWQKKLEEKKVQEELINKELEINKTSVYTKLELDNNEMVNFE